MVTLLFAADWMTTVSFGEVRPFEPGQNEAAWAKK